MSTQVRVVPRKANAKIPRIHATYVDKIRGRVDTEFFGPLSDEWRATTHATRRRQPGRWLSERCPLAREGSAAPLITSERRSQANCGSSPEAVGVAVQTFPP
jgi:hypothetical protein